MSDNIHKLGLEESDRISSTLGGGFPKGSLVVLEGPDGAGKSVWSQRFAAGFADEDLSVTYVSPEHRTIGFINQMDSLGYPVMDKLLHGSFLYLWADLDGMANERNLLHPFLNSESFWERSDVVVVDNLDLLMINDSEYQLADDRGAADEAIQSLYRGFEERAADGTTIILTVDPEIIPEAALRPLRQISDIYLKMNMNVGLSDIKRGIDVLRFTSMQEYVDDKINYSVEPNIGIIIETQTIT